VAIFFNTPRDFSILHAPEQNRHTAVRLETIASHGKLPGLAFLIAQEPCHHVNYEDNLRATARSDYPKE
jgi:hypothetical protein